MVWDQEVGDSKSVCMTESTRLLEKFAPARESVLDAYAVLDLGHFRGIKGAIRIPRHSFQYLRRPGCTAQLLCFYIAGRFGPHRLNHL